LEEVALLAASVGVPPHQRREIVARDVEPLAFGSDDVWDFDDGDP